MRRFLLAPFLILSAVIVIRASQAPSRPAESAAPAEAIRLTNLGVASMNQQKFEQGLQWFEKAAAADPTLVVARVNQAIALINLQRYEPARELLVAVTTGDPQNGRAWYNLGLLQKSTGEAEASLASFQKAASVRPGDAHSHYFVGLMAAQIQQSDEAKAHLERFQRLTTEKIASAMSLGYGDQGPLSLAEALVPKDGAPPPPVPVTFVAAAPDVFAAAGGSAGPGHGVATGGCLFDADGDGINDYLALNPRSEPGKPGDAAMLYRGGAGGTFGRAVQAGLTITSQPLGCAAADYDNDEKPDVAISAAGGLTLFHNEGGGRF